MKKYAREDLVKRQEAFTIFHIRGLVHPPTVVYGGEDLIDYIDEVYEEKGVDSVVSHKIHLVKFVKDDEGLTFFGHDLIEEKED